MKKSEIVSNNYVSILDAIGTCYRDALEHDGSMQYGVYVWEDGEIEILPAVTGDSTYLVPKDCEPRQLVHVMTVGGNTCHYSDGLDGTETEDEITTWLDELAGQYLDEQVEYDLDDVIEELKRQEDLEI